MAEGRNGKTQSSDGAIKPVDGLTRSPVASALERTEIGGETHAGIAHGFGAEG
jgi:hypothetical protein